MRNRLLFLATFFSLFIFRSHAQIVGTDVFLQGAYLEIGMQSTGAFGTNSSPAGYHPHVGGGTQLAEVYDYGHDGWTTGTPPYMGDYTYPGSPFEGWEIQYNGARTQGYQSFTGTTYPVSGGGTMTGAGITGYSNAGGVARANWAGTVASGALDMKTVTRIDTLGSAVTITVFLHNTSGTAIPGVYYWRSCDPDNDESWFGATYFTTNNMINFQNTTVPNPTHKVMVTATGMSSTLPPLTLCTKDCRAVAVIYRSWGLTVGQDLAAVWSQTYTGGGAYYNTGVNYNGDIGIGIVWNIGTILPGDSAALSYAYVFNGIGGIDSAGALPDPVLTVGGVPITSYPYTLDGCLLPGIDSVPLDVKYGDEYDWTFGSWTWAPATGLSSTTGVHNHVHLNAIPGDITYTITGTDSGGYMGTCLNAQFILTVHSCHQAYSNDPCEGGAIHLGMLGDSLTATYFWYGPGGFTSYVHNPIIFPATMADTGIYYVVRTIGGINDTDFTHVMVHPLPIVTPSSNIPLCGPISDSLTLFVNLDSTFETFDWGGPFGFASQIQNPVINPFDSSLAGTYVVTGTTRWGCSATASIDIFPGVAPEFWLAIHHGCYFDTVYFHNTTFNANNYTWAFGDGDTAYTRDAVHIYPATATDTFTVVMIGKNPHCTAFKAHIIDTRHKLVSSFWPTPDTFCLGYPTTFVNTSTDTFGNFPGLIVHYDWDFGNGRTDTAVSPTYTYDAPGRFTASLTVTDSIGCQSTSVQFVNVMQLTGTSFDSLLCIGVPLAMVNYPVETPTIGIPMQFVWNQNIPNLSDTSIDIPTLSGVGHFVDALTISLPGVVPDGCPITKTFTIDAVLGAVLTGVTPDATIAFGTSIHLNSGNEVIYYWVPNDGSLDNPNINNPIATPSVTTTYTVYGLDVNGCLDSAYVTIHVDTSSPGEVPSGFSPNDDGLNDVFRPAGAKFGKVLEFRVYNRWGEEIFYSNNREKGWDGKYHGIPQDVGVYFYEIIVATPGGENKTYKGTVTLVR